MTILSYFNKKNYLNSLTSVFDKTVKRLAEPQLQIHSLDHYVDLLENTAQVTHELGRTMIVEALQEIDKKYRHSKIRKQYYHVKNYRERSLITIYGQVRFKRTIYQNKSTGKCYTYLDEKLGLPKYDRYDPTVKSMIVELYANQNSMIKVGEIVGSKIFSPFTTSSARHEHRISRQTVHNIVSKAPTVAQNYERKKQSPEILYIMADEKYIPIQTGLPGKQSKMVKHAVIYEGIGKKNKRKFLLNKTNIANTERSFWSTVYDTVSSIYEIDLIKNIYILGDGAPWIKAGVKEFGAKKSTFVLDRFHFKQAIQHIDKNKTLQEILESHTLFGTKNDFKMIINAIMQRENNLSRNKVIEEKTQYILNHWIPIRRAYHEVKLGCSMESAISHNLASLYTSRPKAYKPIHLERYLHTRMQHLNGIDIQNHYLKTQHLDPNNIHEPLDKETFDYSMFDPKPSSQHTISKWFKDFTLF